MATHSSILAWKIPWTEKPGGLQSMGLQRVGHNLVTERACTRVSSISFPKGNTNSLTLSFRAEPLSGWAGGAVDDQNLAHATPWVWAP